ncbi:MAG TPA: type II secretion system F family protein [Pirellulales bacterium]|jgi:general secretion pathway protein F|nr:type II secretion system F family protein [Pirellulales bacterium]
MSERPSSGAAALPDTQAIGAVSLDDLIALNDEIVALIRGGVPLERGLVGLSGDFPGRLRRISAALARRMSQGESLAAAMAAEPETFPPVYRALVAAGLRCGRLGPVLEGLANSARKLREVRQIMLMALLYPLGVVLLAFGLFAFLVAALLPTFSELYDRHPPAALDDLLSIGKSVGIWGPIVPIVVVLVFGLWWYRSSRALVLQLRGRGLLSSMPGVRSLLASAQATSLADILALMLEQGVPLDEAVRLAAATVNDPATHDAAQTLAVAVQRGGAAVPDTGGPNGLTPFLRWLIANGQNERTLVPLVRHTAQIYRQRTLRQADWLRTYLPTVLTIGIGGMATLIYCLAVFIPYANLLKSLADRL